MIVRPAAIAAAFIFLAVTAGILLVARSVALLVLAQQWQRGNFVTFSFGFRPARVAAGEPLLASLPATLVSTRAARTRGLLVITPRRIAFQAAGTSADVAVRAVRHLTVEKDGALALRTDGAGLGGTLKVPNPAAVAQLIQAAARHPNA